MKDYNYYNTFIRVAPDCGLKEAKIPQAKNSKKTIAAIEYELLAGEPYTHTQADVLFQTHLARSFGEELPDAAEIEALREAFFSKAHACLRCSPLAKTYGWGLHFDPTGKIGLVPLGGEQYDALAKDAGITQLYAMRNKR